MMNPTFRRLGKTGAMEVDAHSGAHFQLVGLNGRARLDHTRCCFELPRTREYASPLEWQGKIPHTRNRGTVTAKDILGGGVKTKTRF